MQTVSFIRKKKLPSGRVTYRLVCRINGIRKEITPGDGYGDTLEGAQKFKSAFDDALNRGSVQSLGLSMSREGWVYFAQAGDEIGPVKIGFTRFHPASRIERLQTGSPRKITLLLALLGNQEDEGLFHEMFAADRLEGEWFQWTSALRGIIGYLKIHRDADPIERLAVMPTDLGGRTEMTVRRFSTVQI